MPNAELTGAERTARKRCRRSVRVERGVRPRFEAPRNTLNAPSEISVSDATSVNTRAISELFVVGYIVKTRCVLLQAERT